MKKKLGIMQGRLLPPQGGHFQSFPIGEWEREFPAARDAGFFAIEWIYDVRGEGANPLQDSAGIERIRSAMLKSGVLVHSLVADYYMEKFLLRGELSDRQRYLEHLKWLMGQCQQLGIERIVLPFVDASKIEVPADLEAAVNCLQQLLSTAESTGVELHLETSLNPMDFSRLLAQLPHPKLWANYDSGNSASLGYKVTDEFAAYGSRIGSVHIKDRLLNGGTVPLGTGAVDFPALMGCLAEVGYTRDFILQVARGEPGDEINWSRRNREYVDSLIEEFPGKFISTADVSDRGGIE